MKIALIFALLLAAVTLSAARVPRDIEGLTNTVMELIVEYGEHSYGRPTGQTGGIIVNQNHLRNSGRAPAMQARYASSHGGLPMFVSTDQEGGRVSRLSKSFPGFRFYSHAEMGGMSTAKVEAHAKEVGRRLLAKNVNMILAPVLDVAGRGTLMVKQGRAFGDNVDNSIAKGTAFVQGIKQGYPGAITVSKHYPGYNVRGNSDVNRVVSRESRNEVLRRAELFFVVPHDAVMMNSIVYENFGNVPAVFSKELIDILRSRNRDIVVMTDDIMAPSLTPRSPRSAQVAAMTRNAVAAFAAGCDLLLNLDNRNRNSARMARAVAEYIIANNAFGKLEASLARVNKLRRKIQNGTPRNAPSVAVADCFLDSARVTRAQQALLNAGFDPNGIDGKPGNGFRAALRAYTKQRMRAESECLNAEILAHLER